jgi:hypothetical protein
VNQPDLAAAPARPLDLEREAVGDGAEVGGERVHRRLDRLRAGGEVVDVAERTEWHGEADLGRELFARRPAERLFVQPREGDLGEEGVERLELLLAQPRSGADRVRVQAEGAEGSEQRPRGHRG